MAGSWVLFALLASACATYTEPDLKDRTPGADGGNDGEGQGGSAEMETGGGGGGSSSEGGSGAGASSAGKPSTGGAGAGGLANGGTGGTSGAATGGGGTGGRGGAGGSDPAGGSAGAAGRGGNGGSGGTAGSGGTGGSGGGGGGTSGSAGTGGASGGSGGSAGSGGNGGGTVNLINNAGFETNTTGWSVFGGSASIQASTAQAHGGSRSLLITGRTQTYQGPQYNVLSVIAAGKSYTLSLWGRLAASNPTGSLIATFRYTCSGGTNAGDNYDQWVAATAASASAWTELTATDTFPSCAGGTMTAAWLYVESPTATLSYYIDDVVLTEP